MTSAPTPVDESEAVHWLRIINLTLDLAFGLYLAWVLVVPESTKIEIKARVSNACKRPTPDRRRADAAHLRFAIVQLESVSERELATEVEKWPRVA